MPLTDVKIRQAKADVKPLKLTDANGLYLEVKPNGSKLWRYRFRLGEKENLFAIGEYPTMTLADARKERDAARELVRQGINPAHERRKQRLENLAAGQLTFKATAEEWLEKKARRATAKHIRELRRMFEMYVYPHMGALPLGAIKPQLVLTVIRKIEAAGSPSIAIKARTYISNVFAFAIVEQRCEFDPASPLRAVTIEKPPIEHARPLSREELKAIFRAAAIYKNRRTAIAMKLLLMLFPRTIELVRAENHEISLKASEWRVPPEKIKSRRLHIVPLPRQAKTLIEELHSLYNAKGYLLPVLHSNAKRPHMSRATINAALEYMLPNSPLPITGHDFRATASTQLHEMGWPTEVVEMQLSHLDKDKTRATYNHAKYLPQRREMMQQWADWLDAVEAEALAENQETRVA
ncbi:integrase arm-type DNA-binding domain-containing protein [Paraburkholderia sp. SARCC-3016]|uniref:tyrosine-type recombinase/integrase n=1 Tax=Paraburkholderia sp. SARCC-3016 TaxID=3058611 RepID=UPI0028091C2E|nr:integrase arm-type DNA-binding domain-containing protein [Paraburkholderia sp. SARCC-3016]MDQ7977169.1 integrase arm-type DNA-binding domain-containing protein [Paraburkholderia sp. SARCC-3016]